MRRCSWRVTRGRSSHTQVTSREVRRRWWAGFRRAPDEQKTAARDYLGRRLAYVAPRLEGRTYLLGEQFTVADAYLYTVLTWTKFARVDLGGWPVLGQYDWLIYANRRAPRAE